jgi:7-carboxy-7-deazaguanine synthase
MFIAEIFQSIQGEGALCGTPSIFIRTSGCNLRCGWCDTKFASWSPEGEELTMTAILARVAEYPAGHCVVTGGEPMVSPRIGELTRALRNLGKHVTLETAATIAPDGVACDLASLSPKLANSTPGDRLSPGWRERHERLRYAPGIIRHWLDRFPCQFKFVVTGPDDLREIDALLAAVGRPVAADRIFLMPEGVEAAVLESRAAFINELCRERGYRYGQRLHIELFGNTRGT